jgi:hypothetical protein
MIPEGLLLRSEELTTGSPELGESSPDPYILFH